MEQTVQISFAVLAAFVTVLAGIVAWVYWQQTRLFANMNGIVMVIGELSRQHMAAEPVEQAEPEKPPVVEPAPVEEEEEDDRVDVEPEIVEGPPAPLDTDALESKTKKDLQDILTKRGIPFGKGDNKTALISLLKATA